MQFDEEVKKLLEKLKEKYNINGVEQKLKNILLLITLIKENQI